eukprot:TRINITY_DN6914_c0_g1_i1.p1 TRINITY_DN6914_c0_g1~~TRINITY_DN6914_c0_g1_i1.p1  ORF type:complete len:316 (+),score=101.44 TRINITY_DN6914_c0_g1_i1:24-971(+)
MFSSHVQSAARMSVRAPRSPSSLRWVGQSTRSLATVSQVGVVGAGQMGTGIAKVAIATAEKKVLLMDTNQDVLNSATSFIEKLLQKDVAKGKMTEEQKTAATARLSTTTKLEDFSTTDFVIEAATENPELKFNIFKSLDEILPKDAILATNTSSISITKIAGNTERPEKVIGMHFMNPVPVMKLVEIIPGLITNSETKETTLKLAELMGKTTTQSSDFAGFIANRLLCPYLNEAFNALAEGLGTREDIDATMKLGTNMPMGPLTLADFIGLDTVLSIMRVLQGEFGDKFMPAPLLVRYVESGRLGKKVGKGVYEY